jgi:hypothetical protein
MHLKKRLAVVFAILGIWLNTTNAHNISTFDGKTGKNEIAQGWQKNKYLGQGQAELTSDAKGGQALTLVNDLKITKKAMHVYNHSTIPVKPGEKIRISLRIKGKGNYTIGLYCFSQKNGPYIGCQVKELFPGYKKINTDKWKSFTFDYTVSTEKINGFYINAVKIFFAIGNGKITIDDVEFARVKPKEKPVCILKNNHSEIAFASAANGFSCLKITDSKGKTRFVFPELSAQNNGLWQLNFVKSGQTDKITLDNRVRAVVNSTKKKLADGSQELSLTWNNISFADEKNVVDVIVKVLLKSDGESNWRINVKNRSSKYGLFSVDFPRFLTVAAPSSADVVFPGGVLGGTLRKANRKAGRFIYPSESWPMHFMSFATAGKGLYIGLHDPLQRPSKAYLSPGQDIIFRQFPDNMGQPGTDYNLNFPIVVKLHDGDWWKAAKIYRKWLIKLPRWYNKPLSERNLPKAFWEAGIWLCMWQDPRAVANIVIRMENYFGVKAGAFWCEWGKHIFDHNLPEFFPFRPNTPESVKKMKDNGTAVMPYMNARAWGQDHKEYSSARVQMGLVKDHKGKFDIKSYGTVVCPSYSMWRKKILEINEKLIDEAGVNAVYWDQVGAAVPLQCFAKNHDHAAGWNHWVKAYNSLLAQTRKYIIGKKQVALSTESGPDAYDFDGYLNCWWNKKSNGQNAIPLTAAVLCDRVRFFPLPPNMQTFQAYVMIHGRFFLWGMPAPIHHRESEKNKFPCSDAERSKAHATIRKMIQCRITAKKFMVYGELMGELKSSKPLSTVSAVFKSGKIENTVTFPAVRGSVWKSVDDELGFAFVNFSGSKQAFNFETNTRQYTSLSPRKWQVLELQTGNEKVIGKTGSKFVTSVVLEPYGVKFLILKPQK